MIIIDGTNALLGRVAAFAAKKALLGEQIAIVNCNAVVISGNPVTTVAKYKQRRDRGTHTTGPFFPRYSDQIMKRTIRGMLPYKQPKGNAAYKRISCYRTVPTLLQGKPMLRLEEAQSASLPTKTISLQQLARKLGAKQ
ncbi:MAG: 50S ribosomal protein L13 [Candidatus Woesearchaeota archaeon]